MADMTPEERLEALQVLAGQISTQEDIVTDLKAELAAAKAKLQRLEKQLRDDAKDPPLFDVATATREDAPDEDAWKSVRLDDPDHFNLPEGLLAKLAEKEIETLGDLSAWQEKHGDFWAKEIPGVGQAARQKIDDQMAEFFTARADAEKAAAEDDDERADLPEEAPA